MDYDFILSALKLIRKEYLTDPRYAHDSQFDAYRFTEYVQDKYGIEMRVGRRRGYRIVDETKYTYFLLKFQ